MSISQFIIGQEDKGFSVFFKFVSATAIRMTDRYGCYLYRTDIKFLGTGFFIFHLRFNIVVFYRKIRRRHHR